MLHKTKGIVLNYIPYGDSSIIAKVYTEIFGAQSYIINGARSKSGKSKIGFFQPLTLLDLVVYFKDNQINRISEIKCSKPFRSLHTDLKKASITMFLTEVLGKILFAEKEHLELFEFMEDALTDFDQQEAHYENFHLQFLLKLTRHLGLEVESAEDFHREINHFKAIPSYSLEIDVLIDNLIKQPWDEPCKMHNAQRRLILDSIMSFYQHQLGIATDSKSLQILRELFS